MNELDRLHEIAQAWNQHPVDSFWYPINAVLGMLDQG